MSLFNNNSNVSPYLILHTQTEAKNLFCLTPHIMQWKDNTWILDLKPVLNYWHRQARKTDLSLRDLFEKMLYLHFSEGFSAVFSDHPWQGLLLLKSLRRSGFQQTVHSDGLFGQKLFQNLRWEEWYQTLEELSEHMDDLGQSNLSYRLPSHIKQMKTTMERLKVSRPEQVKSACPNSMEKRFGPLIRRAWCWSFKSQKDSTLQLSLFDRFEGRESFPWVSYEWSETRKVERLLEFACSSWDVIEPMLLQDLKKLAGSTFECELIQQMDWCLTLEDMTTLLIPIHFRNPYSLKQDAQNDFKTARNQAYYAFESYLKTKIKEQGEAEYVEYHFQVPFVAWHVGITNTLVLTTETLSLLKNHSQTQKSHQLVDLENKLPLEVEHYQLTPNYHMREDYTKEEQQHSSPQEIPLHNWEEAAYKRPLFLFKQEKQTEAPKKYRRFLERLSLPWWRTEEPESYRQDLYEGFGEDKKLSLVGEVGGRWFAYGHFD